jgi:hypothetical protein
MLNREKLSGGACQSARSAGKNPCPFRRLIGGAFKFSSKIATLHGNTFGGVRSFCSPPMGSARTRSCGEHENPVISPVVFALVIATALPGGTVIRRIEPLSNSSLDETARRKIAAA